MGDPSKHASTSPGVETVTPGFSTSKKRDVKRSLLINAAVAVGAVMVYQGICSLVAPSARAELSQSVPFRVASIERRGEVDERAAGHNVWDKIEPSSELRWEDCYEKFKCARLETPLDYFNGTGGTAVMAIAMLPARVPVTDPRYAGPLLVNPGGPGGSGTDLALAEAALYQKMFDTPGTPSRTQGNKNARYYDIVGIDPRGVGKSIPLASCFRSNFAAAQWNARHIAAGLPGSSNTGVSDSWAMMQAYAQSCQRLAKSRDRANNILPFVTTASTARDMVTFVDRYAEWRHQHARRALKGRVPRALEYSPGKEKIQYWGVSYGTFLGSTLASLYPDRVGRFILDGVLDADDYIHGFWTDNLADTEKTAHAFYSGCSEAGPQKCALAKPGSKAKDVKARVDAILNHIKAHPVLGQAKLPDLLTWSTVKLIIGGAMYSPIGWGKLAQALVTFEGAMSLPLGPTSLLEAYPQCGVKVARTPIDARNAISCGDAFPQPGFDIQAAQAHFEHLYDLSPTLASPWAELRYTCAAWPMHAKYSFRGPFGATASDGVPPILFIGNTADPVTPLRNAEKMASLFEGARVLTHDSPGHASVQLPSTCTIRHMRQYLHDGTVPPEGTVCETDVKPFEEPGPERPPMDVLDDPDVSVDDEDGALKAAQEHIRGYFQSRQLELGVGLPASR